MNCFERKSHYMAHKISQSIAHTRKKNISEREEQKQINKGNLIDTREYQMYDKVKYNTYVQKKERKQNIIWNI